MNTDGGCVVKSAVSPFLSQSSQSLLVDNCSQSSVSVGTSTDKYDGCDRSSVKDNTHDESLSAGAVIWRRFGELLRFALYRRQQHFNIHSNSSLTPSCPSASAQVTESTTGQHRVSTEPHSKESNLSVDESSKDPKRVKRCIRRVVCRLCLTDYAYSDLTCLRREMVTLAINEARVMIPCPLLNCNQHIHPTDIANIIGPMNPSTLAKYEQFMVRKVLQTIPDCRWCPAPDCPYAVIATGCASCPKLRCEFCQTEFCYHCQQIWHPDSTCNDASSGCRFGITKNPRRPPSKKRTKFLAADTQKASDGGSANVFYNNRRARVWYPPNINTSSGYEQLNQYNVVCQKKLREAIKRCPCCKVAIMKVDDGSCNHMTCSQCGSEFCWLCLKVITDIHFLSPSGCTFWGRKRWSRRKKAIWQCLALLGAPIGISLAACISVPVIFVSLPIWAGRKTYRRLAFQSKQKRNVAVFLTSISALLVAPVIASVTVVVGVPVLLTYTYAVIPMSMCKNDNCLDGFRNGVNDELLIEEDGTDVDENNVDSTICSLLDVPLDLSIDKSSVDISSSFELSLSEKIQIINNSTNMMPKTRSGENITRNNYSNGRKIKFANSLDSFSPLSTRVSQFSCFDACGTVSGIMDHKRSINYLGKCQDTDESDCFSCLPLSSLEEDATIKSSRDFDVLTRKSSILSSGRSSADMSDRQWYSADTESLC